ncbi:hypothetical protein FGB62_5g247 [Gracilaria domingensis]|nr:hypothetical protein FGB62_5g247 [Gracilaria domingensis]
MPTNSTPSLPTSPSPTRKAFSSQHNVWNKLLFRAEKRGPQIESHLYLPRDPGDDHLRASFEDYLINHELQIEAVFRIPVRAPARPKRKAAKRCIPHPSTYRAQEPRALAVAPLEADDNRFDVVLVDDVLASTLPSTNGSDDYVIRRKNTGKSNESGSDIPRSQRLRNDRALYSEPSTKPSLLVLPQQHAPERSRRRVSKSTPLSTLHNPLSSLEPSEDSPTLYSCDSRAVASRIESTPDVRVEDSSLDVVPMVPSSGRRAKSGGTKRDSHKSNSRRRLKRAKHSGDGDMVPDVFSLSPRSCGSEMSKPEAGVAEPRRFKSIVNLCSSDDDDIVWSDGIGSKPNRFKRNSKKPEGNESLGRTKIGFRADAPMRGTDPFSLSEDAIGFNIARVKSNRAKRDSKEAKGRGSLNRTVSHSKADTYVRETDLLSFSEDDLVGSAAARTKSNRTKRYARKTKGRGRSNRTTSRSTADASVREMDLLSCSEDDLVSFAAAGTRSHRVKRDAKKAEGRGGSNRAKTASKACDPMPQTDLFSGSEDDVVVGFDGARVNAKGAKRGSKKAKVRESLKGTKHGSKADVRMRQTDPFSLSEDDVVGFDGARVKSNGAKPDSKAANGRGSTSAAKANSKEDVPVHETDLLSFSEDVVAVFEAGKTKTRETECDSSGPEVRGSLNGRKQGSKGDASLRVMSLSSSEDDVSHPEAVACHRPRFAFRKSVGSIVPTQASCDVDEQYSSESGILALPPDCQETHLASNQSSSCNAGQRNDEGHEETASKHKHENKMLLPLGLRRVGVKVKNKRAESNKSLSPAQTESMRTFRRDGKRRASSTLARRLMIRSQPQKMSEVHMSLQPTETPGNKNQNIRSKTMTASNALSSDLEIDGSSGGEDSGNLKDSAIPASSNCSEDVSHKGRCSPHDVSEGRLLRKPKTMPTPTCIGKRRQLTIPLTLRVRQPRDVDMCQSPEKRRRTGGVGRKEKSKNRSKSAPGRKNSRGQVGKRRSEPERESMALDKQLCQSSSHPGHVAMKDQDIAVGKELNISLSRQRYPLRSSKQVSEHVSDSPTTRRAAKYVGRKSYDSILAQTTDSSEPSRDAQLGAIPSSELLPANVNEGLGFEGSRPSGDGDVEAKRLFSGKTSPSKGLHRKARADIFRRQSSSSRKWKKDNVTARGKRRRVRGENGSKRFGLSGSDVTFPPLGSLRKRGTRKSKHFG